MANNCLKTQLIGTVTNNALPKFGVAVCRIKKAATYNDIRIESGKQVTITLPDGVDLWFNSSKTNKSRTFTGTGSPQYFSLYGDETGVVNCEVTNFWNVNGAASSYFGMDMKCWRYSVANTFELAAEVRGLESGNIEDMYIKTSLYIVNITKNPDVYGSINTLADKMFAAGRISGHLYIYANGSGVTKNGASFSDAHIQFSESGWSFV